MTDRLKEKDQNGNFHYGYGRSSSLAFGTTVVDLGQNLSWEELLDASRTQKRIMPVKMYLRKVTELIRSPDIPLPYNLLNGEVIEEPELLGQFKKNTQDFRHHLVQQLALTPRKEVFIYIHGYHNTFDDAAVAMAELWHFIGRISVPIIYKLASGIPGVVWLYLRSRI